MDSRTGGNTVRDGSDSMSAPGHLETKPDARSRHVLWSLAPFELTFCPLRLSNLLPSALSSPFGPTRRHPPEVPSGRCGPSRHCLQHEWRHLSALACVMITFVSAPQKL